MRYYLAYGSNLNKRQMSWRCPTARPVGAAYLKGYELLFKGSQTGAYLTIEENPEGVVPVAVWRVTKQDEAALDIYEGYPAFYYKKDLEVLVNGRKIKAFVYIMHEDRKVGMPSDGYMSICHIGYRDFGFDHKYLTEAIIRSREVGYGENMSEMRKAL